MLIYHTEIFLVKFLWSGLKKKIPAINHFTSLCGQDIIFPHDISTIS